MAEEKKMSVAEILAAARKTDAKGGADAPAAAPAASKPAPAEPVADEAAAPAAAAPEPVESTPAPVAKPAAAKSAGAPKLGGARPNVAEILAMARANKGEAAAAHAAKAAAAPVAEKPKPAAKPAAAKPAAKTDATNGDTPAAKPAAGGASVRSTASILAAARSGTKAGPMSKAEAAKLKPSPAPAPKPEPASAKFVVPPMPTKPDYAKPKPAKAATAKAGAAKGGTEPEERRWFLGMMFGSFLGVGFTSLAATTGLWTLGLARFMFPNVLTEPPNNFRVGFPADFPPGSVSEKFKAQFGVWIVNTEYQGQREIIALKSVCTHLGCTPNWLEAEQKFKCPCHGSGFYKDGINFEGPAPRPLERYSIALAPDGQLQVDKSKTFQEEMGQWIDPLSFVPA